MKMIQKVKKKFIDFIEDIFLTYNYDVIMTKQLTNEVKTTSQWFTQAIDSWYYIHVKHTNIAAEIKTATISL